MTKATFFYLLLIFTINISAQEITEITFNKKQTHFFYIKNKDSLFVKSVKANTKPIFISNGCTIETTSAYRRWVQNDKKILFEKNNELYVFELSSSSLKKIPLKQKINFFYFYLIDEMASHGNYLYFATRDQDKEKFYSLYQLNFSNNQLTKLLSVENRHIANVAISNDGSLIAYTYFDKASLWAKSGLHVFNLKKDATIYQHQERDSSFFKGLKFSDKKDLFFRDVVNSENIMVTNLISKANNPKAKVYPTEKYNHFLKFLSNDYILTVNTNNKKTYEIYDKNTGQKQFLLDGANVVVKSIQKDNNTFTAFISDENGKTPVQLHKVIIDTTTSRMSKEIIFTTVEKNPYEDTEYSIESYNNASNGTNTALLYFPKSYKKSKSKLPLIIMVYGCYTDKYPSASYFMDTIILDYVNKGFAVAKLNTRGLCDENLFDGYGKIQLEDTEVFVDHITKKYPINKNEVIVAGHSHGATMVYYYLTHSNKFAAGLAFNGASDWVKQAQQASMTGLPQEMGGTPEELPKKYKAYSPLENINSRMKPMFIITGAKDSQIIDSINSKVFVEKAKKLNLNIEYHCFEDEGHVFLKKQNKRLIREKLEAFLDSLI